MIALDLCYQTFLICHAIADIHPVLVCIFLILTLRNVYFFPFYVFIILSNPFIFPYSALQVISHRPIDVRTTADTRMYHGR